MVMWIILGYLAISMLASIIFYAACRMAARADRALQQTELDSQVPSAGPTGKRAKPVPAPKWALHM